MTQKQPNNGPAPTCLLWFRFDLRLKDHAGVMAALNSGLPIIALYIYDETLGTRPLGAASRWWLHRSLMSLDTALRARGSRLIIRSGNSAEVLTKIFREYNVKTIIYSHSFDPRLEEQDVEITRHLTKQNVTVTAFNTTLLAFPNQIRTHGGEPYRVFTPFYRNMVGQGFCEGDLPPTPDIPWPKPDPWPESQDLDSLGLNKTLSVSGHNWAKGFDIWTPGEDGAHKRLARFIAHGLKLYGDHRDRPDIDATSRLSPHLRFGEISPQRLLHDVIRATALHPHLHSHADKFRSEVVWREFSYGLLAQQPNLHSQNFRTGFALNWLNGPKDFKAWTRGLTGYSLVDAGMRELWQTGFMHNRVRMIAASFLIKDLLIDWRRGEDWFWDCLVDADPASNAASWQWVAGCGADAAPYFRIFNPITQAEKFDPKAQYRRRFIQGYTQTAPKPALSKHHNDLFDQVDDFQTTHSYPPMIVDHAFARDRALAAFDRSKDRV